MSYDDLKQNKIPLGEPTAAPPGSHQKLLCLIERYEDGLDLWHPEDYVPIRDESHRRRELLPKKQQEGE